MVSLEAIALVCLTVVSVVFFVVGANNSRRKTRDSEDDRLQKIKEGASSHHVDAGNLDTTCEICFGEIGDEIVRVCQCGRVFHVDCADATDECPYCKRKRGTMTERNAIRTVCPLCGRRIERNVCECGAVIPNADGTYVCRCGETVSVGSDRCGKCGSSIRKEIVN